MNQSNSKIAVVALIFALLAGGVAVLKSGGASVAFVQAKVAQLDAKIDVVRTSLGSATSPDIPSPYIQYGGVVSERGHDNVPGSSDTKTNVLCAIQAPSATSTLTHLSIKLDTATATPLHVTFATAATDSATTTLIGGSRLILATSTSGVFSATTSGAFAGALGAGRDTTIPPNWYIVVDMWQNQTLASNGLAGGIFNPGGICNAEFIKEI